MVSCLLCLLKSPSTKFVFFFSLLLLLLRFLLFSLFGPVFYSIKCYFEFFTHHQYSIVTRCFWGLQTFQQYPLHKYTRFIQIIEFDVRQYVPMKEPKSCAHIQNQKMTKNLNWILFVSLRLQLLFDRHSWLFTTSESDAEMKTVFGCFFFLLWIFDCWQLMFGEHNGSLYNAI